MLDQYFELERTLRRMRSGPFGDQIDGFAAALHAGGYAHMTSRYYLRAVEHLGQWARAQNIPIRQLNEEQNDAFAHHRPDSCCLRKVGSGERNNKLWRNSAQLFIEHLRRRGVVPEQRTEPGPMPPLIEEFSHWMRHHRGATETTIVKYRHHLVRFTDVLGVVSSSYDACGIRSFVLNRASQLAASGAKQTVTAVRMFLRYLSATDRCSPDLVAAVPKVANWRLSSLPRYLPPEDVERVIEACDPCTPCGTRDRAMILLLARLGLRAGDVANLCLDHIDWSQSRLRVMGKGRRETWLPLPQDVGDAILEYLRLSRPVVEKEHVFLKLCAPMGPLQSSAVSMRARRAIQRAGIDAPSKGAHVLRHSAATALLRQGASLEVIGALLRHRSCETTAHYAKVDLDLLRQVVQPWPSEEESLC